MAREYSYSRKADNPYKKYLSANQMNQQIERMIDAGFVPPTRLAKYQEGHTAIVVENDLDVYGAGFVRTFEETNRYLERRGMEPMSRQQYRTELQKLQNKLGKERTYTGVVEAYRKRIKDIVSDMNKELEVHLDIKHFSTADLYNAIKNASQEAQDASSGYFYEFLYEEIRSLR